MASQNTTLFNAQIGTADYVTTDGSQQKYPSSTEGGGKVVVIADTYTPTSTMAATTVLGICKLPAGSKVISVEFIVPASMVTSSAKIGIGTISGTGTITVTDDDRYGTALDLSAVGRYQAVKIAADADYVNTTEVALTMTIVTGTLAANPFAFIVTYIAA